MEGPGGLQSSGSQRVEHAWAGETKRRVNIVFDWAGSGSYLRKEHLKESYCFSQLVAVNWGMWKFVQISMWKAPLKTELFERWRLTLVRSWLWLNGPTIVNKRSKMLKYCSWIYCIIICCIMTCSMHVLWGLFQTLVKILFGDTHSSLYKELGIELLKWYFWVQLS